MQTSVHLKVFQNKKFIFKKHVINIGPKTDQKIPHFMAPIYHFSQESFSCPHITNKH